MSDDFPARLRELVDDALPLAPIDPDVALGVVRRRTRRTRARRTAASLAVAAVAVAGGLTIPGFMTDNSSLVVAAPTSVELAPGIRAATSMVAFKRDGGGSVYDTGMSAWDTDARFLFTTDDHLITGVYVGGDDDIEQLRTNEVEARAEPPTSAWSPDASVPSADADEVEAMPGPLGTTLIVLSSPDDSWSLTLGTGSTEWASSDRSTHLVARDLFTGPDGAQVSSVVLPANVFTPAADPVDTTFFAVVAHDTRGTVPSFAGVLSQTVESSSGMVYEWGATTCSGEECTTAVTWSPTAGTATEERALDATTTAVQERLKDLSADPEVWQRGCVEIRTQADEERHVVRTQFDRETQCRFDAALRSMDLAIEHSNEAPS
ncbi:hypothetical protein [Cellulosimicrobium sp. NPDC057127]|uniref:hypothetical protein n=1 Tax=Cellulosimicrobium sp. NPDC057127 TaxID=3346026 RepID=UPI00364432F0